jgi:uncharacterized protein YraI
MTRYAAIAIVLWLSAAPGYAQGTTFTITTTTASVHTGPSVGTPVVATLTKGKTLEVTGELGSWVRIPWPAVPGGSGYLHVAWGTLTHRNPAAEAGPAPVTAPPPVPTVAAAGTRAGAESTSPRLDSAGAASIVATQVDLRAEQAASRTQPQTISRPQPRSQPQPALATVAIPSHIVGIGGRIATPAFGLALSGRVWANDALGIQLELGRSTVTSAQTFGPRVRTITFGSSAVYSAPPLIAGAVMWRPYGGGGMNVYRATLGLPGGFTSATDSGIGYQAFGGAEVTWASVPNLAVSAELRRDWAPAPFPGFDTAGFGVGLSAHWYVR